MSERTHELVALWLKKGDDDFTVAARLFGEEDMPRSIVCFHCQQAVEKWLKALIIAQAGDPPKTHDLVLLSNLVVLDQDAHHVIKECALDFMEYAVELRYPGDYEPTREDIVKAIQYCRAIFGIVHAQLSSSAQTTPSL